MSNSRRILCGSILLGLVLQLLAAQIQGADLASRGTTTTNASILPMATMDALDDGHRLVVGDRISFRIIEDLEEAKSLPIKDSGQVDVPYLGLFPAVDRTCRQLALELKSQLEREYYYRATVIVAVDQFSNSRGRVYLVGAVQSPGPQEIPSDEMFTVGKAVMRAHGFAEFADKKRVRITRRIHGKNDKPEVIVVNVGELLEKGKVELDVELKPGDIIFVREKSLNF